MLLSLVDLLRCPEPHQESTLVLSVEHWKERQVQHGILACPVCHTRFPIVDGEADFSGGSEVVRPGTTGLLIDPMRLAAQLSLTEPGGLVFLTGTYVGAASALSELAGVTCVVATPAPVDGRGIRMKVGDRLPLTPGVLQGLAADVTHASPEFLRSAVACTRSAGRIVAPAAASVPPGATLLARDDREWVAEVGGGAVPVSLRRAESRRTDF